MCEVFSVTVRVRRKPILALEREGSRDAKHLQCIGWSHTKKDFPFQIPMGKKEKGQQHIDQLYLPSTGENIVLFS